MLKILGILVLLFGLFVTLVGLGGAVLNFGFPPTGEVCGRADEDLQKAQKLLQESDDAKGTPDQYSKANEVEIAVQRAERSLRACSEYKSTYRMYGIVFAVVGVVGFFFVLVGGGLTIWGFKRKKKMA
jgi:hypothetical protein